MMDKQCRIVIICRQKAIEWRLISALKQVLDKPAAKEKVYLPYEPVSSAFDEMWLNW